MEADSNVIGNEVHKLIVKMTTTGKSELNSGHCKELKRFCRESNDIIDLAFRQLWSQLHRKHSEVRLSCVQVFDVLFTRSFHFRMLLIDKLDEYFKLTMGTEAKLPLPLRASQQLKIQSIKCFKKWHEIFSPAYKQLDIAMKYLIECEDMPFKNTEESVLGMGSEGDRMLRLNRASGELEEASEDISLSIQELKRCLHLLLPSLEEFDLLSKDKAVSTSYIGASVEIESGLNEKKGDVNEKRNDNCDKEYDDDDDDTLEDEKPHREYRLNAVSSKTISVVFNKDDKIKVYETPDNKDLTSTLNEKLNLLRKKYLFLVRKTLRLYSKYNAESTLVKTAADFKVEICEVVNKADKLLIIKKDVDEEDDFIEVPFIKPQKNEASQLLDLASSSSKANTLNVIPSSDIDKEDSTSSPKEGVDYHSKPWTVGDPLPKQQVTKHVANRVPKNTASVAGPSIDRSRNYWRDPVFERKLSKAIGVDLTSNALKRKKKEGITSLGKIHKDTGKKRLVKMLTKKKKK